MDSQSKVRTRKTPSLAPQIVFTLLTLLNDFTALNMYEPRIKNKVDLFISHLSKTNGPIDITA